MNNIKCSDDVLGWARMIVDAKGEKYTPLSKSDLYQIALCITAGEQCGRAAEADRPDPPANWNAAGGPPPAPPSVEDEERKGDERKGDAPPPPPQKGDGVDLDALRVNLLPPVTTAVVTRGNAYHRAGFGAQKAYDKFLAWAAEHPSEGRVMDFSTGALSANAAFAYWLAEVIEVELTPTAREA